MLEGTRVEGSGARKGWFKRLLGSRDDPPERLDERAKADLVANVLPPDEERFETGEEIGSGGMAIVELLHDRTLRRRLARKLLRTEMEDERQAVQSFLREAQITGQLQHPNIVPVHDLGRTEDGRLHFTMKLLEGRTYAELVRELPPGPIERGALFDLLEVVVKVCNALAFAHKRGVVHRDVKPENVMVGEFGEVYLVDWGLARLADPDGELAKIDDPVSSTFTRIWGRRVIGTPGYMSPEQAAGGEMDARADIFAVGAMLYFLVARRPPYEGRTSETVILRARQRHFTPLPDDAGAPRELVRILEKAMARKPEDRQQTVVELRQDIVGFMRGGSLPLETFEAGHLLMREGDPGEHAYIIASGSCEVFKEIDGEKVSLRTIGPGECFGETAIMTSEPRTASVVTLEETVVERVSRDQLLEELDAIKPWVSGFLRSLAERFQERETRGD